MPQQPYSQYGPAKKGRGLLLAFILTLCGLIVTGIFAVWAFSSMQDYKTNSDKKVAAATQKAIEETGSAKDKEYTEKMKSPYRIYKGSETYGSVTLTYPATWSAYVDEKGGASPIDGYFNPNFVPGITSQSPFALRMQVSALKYDDYIRQMDSRLKTGTVKASAYRAPKVPSVLGTRFDGDIDTNKKGSLIALPLRDKTLLVWTESASTQSDFNSIVLAELLFVP